MKSQSLHHIPTNTPNGQFHLIATPDQIVRASGFGSLDDLLLRLPAEIQERAVKTIVEHPYQKLIQAYYQGQPSALNNIPHHQTGTEFQQAVWQKIASIPYGHTISYKQLAQQSGRPGAVRAAGTICGLNRLILLIPCHRVLKSDGSTGSYLYGTTIKQSLLRHEGAL